MFVAVVCTFSYILAISSGKGKVGMNLEGKVYFSPGIAWKNRLYQSMPWVSSNGSSWNDHVPIDFDSNGYVKSLKPNQFVSTIFLDGLVDANGVNHYQTPGEHIFLYEGDCSGCQFSAEAKVIDNSKQGRWILNVTGEGLFHIMTIDPSNYPRNMALVPIQYESNWQQDIWDPTWIQPLTDLPFSNLRFMDFLDTNNSPNRLWSKRTLPTNYTMGQQYGVAYEVIIDLCNRMSPIDCWINIPHLADDDYIQKLAEFWYANYTGKGVIHIEYSNECWNGQFQCYHYMVNQSAQEGINPYQWYGQKTCQIRKIWDGVYGDKSATSLFSVMGSFEVNSWITNEELLNGSAQCVDGVAISAYYCMQGLNDTQQLSMTEDQLFDNIESKSTQQVYINWQIQQEQVAKNYKGHNGQMLELIAYEGSWGCVPDTYYQPMRDNLTNLYNSMCHNPRITDTVVEFLTNFHNTTGGTLFNIFSYIGFGGQYGNWGHLQFQDDYANKNSDGRYKFNGIQQYLGAN